MNGFDTLAWYRVEGDAVVQDRVLGEEEATAVHLLVDRPGALEAGRAPVWFPAVDYAGGMVIETVGHLDADGRVDWREVVECPPAAAGCVLGVVQGAGDHVYALRYEYSEARFGYADEFSLLVGRLGAGWTEEVDLTGGPIQPYGLAPLDRDEAWVLGAAPGREAASWARVRSDGTLHSVHSTDGPRSCAPARTGLYRRRPYPGGGAPLEGVVCALYDDTTLWMVAVDADESVVWQRTLSLMNATWARTAWDAERRFILAGGTQNCCHDTLGSDLPFAVITDPDARCLDTFDPRLPPDPWDRPR